MKNSAFLFISVLLVLSSALLFQTEAPDSPDGITIELVTEEATNVTTEATTFTDTKSVVMPQSLFTDVVFVFTAEHDMNPSVPGYSQAVLNNRNSYSFTYSEPVIDEQWRYRQKLTT